MKQFQAKYLGRQFSLLLRKTNLVKVVLQYLYKVRISKVVFDEDIRPQNIKKVVGNVHPLWQNVRGFQGDFSFVRVQGWNGVLRLVLSKRQLFIHFLWFRYSALLFCSSYCMKRHHAVKKCYEN